MNPSATIAAKTYPPPAKHFDRPRAANWHAISLVLRTVFMVLGPVAVCGICVGVSSIILALADRELHSFLLTIVWGAAVLISGVMVTGLVLLGRPVDLPND